MIWQVDIRSTAESFRSTCGSVRGAPECSKQGSPGATPHVGQGTENHSFAVRSLFLILIQYGKTSRKRSILNAMDTIRNGRAYETTTSPFLRPD
jgi:hypothetical protein